MGLYFQGYRLETRTLDFGRLIRIKKIKRIYLIGCNIAADSSQWQRSGPNITETMADASPGTEVWGMRGPGPGGTRGFTVVHGPSELNSLDYMLENHSSGLKPVIK
jgi:hypothetical protein